MIKSTITLLLVLISFQTSARVANVETCKNLVSNFCNNSQIDDQLSRYTENNMNCYITDDGYRESDTKSYYHKKVIFYNKRNYSSVLLNNSCNMRNINTGSSTQIIKAANLSGRFYFLLSSNMLVVINRVNDIMYLVNSSSNPYQNITDIKVHDGLKYLELTHNGLQINTLSESQIEARMFTPQAQVNACISCK